jgi:hypothetical protein
LHTACEYAPDRDRDAQYSSEHLQAVVDEYLKDKTNILGTIVQVDIQGTTLYGQSPSSRTPGSSSAASQRRSPPRWFIKR